MRPLVALVKVLALELDTGELYRAVLCVVHR